MKNSVSFIPSLSLLFIVVFAKAQVGIGTTTPHPSAQLDVTSSNKGFLPPRMISSQRIAIQNPNDGLLVYQTDNSTGLYLRQNNNWVRLPSIGEIPAKSMSIMAFTSGVSIRMIAERSGVEHFGTIVGFSNSVGEIDVRNPTIDIKRGQGTNINHAVIMPINGVLRNIATFFSFTGTIPSGNLNIYVRVYYSIDGISFARLPGAEIVMQKPANTYPSFMKVLRNDFNIPVLGAQRLMIVFSASSDNGRIDVDGFASASLGIE